MFTPPKSFLTYSIDRVVYFVFIAEFYHSLSLNSILCYRSFPAVSIMCECTVDGVTFLSTLCLLPSYQVISVQTPLLHWISSPLC